MLVNTIMGLIASMLIAAPIERAVRRCKYTWIVDRGYRNRDGEFVYWSDKRRCGFNHNHVGKHADRREVAP